MRSTVAVRALVAATLIGALMTPPLVAAVPDAPPFALLEGAVVSTAGGGADAAFKPVTGAIVRAADLSSGAVFDSSASTDQGEYRFESLPAGSYSIAVQTSDGLFLTDEVVTLGAGKTGRVSFALRGREDAAAGGGSAPPHKYDCSSKAGDDKLSDAEKKEKRKFCGWWATAGGWEKFGIIAGSAVAFGAAAWLITDESNDGKDKEKNPTPSAP